MSRVHLKNATVTRSNLDYPHLNPGASYVLHVRHRGTGDTPSVEEEVTCTTPAFEEGWGRRLSVWGDMQICVGDRVDVSCAAHKDGLELLDIYRTKGKKT